MKSFYMDKETFSQLERKNITGCNTESMLYLYKKYLLKIFINEFDLENKKRNLNILDKNRIMLNEDLEEILLPIFFLFIDSEFKGYGMKNIWGISLDKYLNYPTVSFDLKKQVLIKLGLFLEKLDKLREINDFYLNFFINDLHVGNIIVMPDGSIKIIDVDSFKLGDSPLSLAYNLPLFNDVLNKNNKYQKEGDYIVPNRESDIYCYIIIVLKFVTGIDFSVKNKSSYEYYLRELKSEGVNQGLLDACHSVFDESPCINPVHDLKKLKKQVILTK